MEAEGSTAAEEPQANDGKGGSENIDAPEDHDGVPEGNNDGAFEGNDDGAQDEGEGYNEMYNEDNVPVGGTYYEEPNLPLQHELSKRPEDRAVGDIVNLMQDLIAHPFFANLTPDTLAEFCGVMQLVRLEKAAFLTHHIGNFANTLYLLWTGRAAIYSYNFVPAGPLRTQSPPRNTGPTVSKQTLSPPRARTTSPKKSQRGRHTIDAVAPAACLQPVEQTLKVPRGGVSSVHDFGVFSGTLSSGHGFHKIGGLAGGQRNISAIKALEDTVLLTVPLEAYNRITGAFDVQSESLVTFLKNEAGLEKVPLKFLVKLVDYLKPHILVTGQALYRQGDPAKSCYWIRGGRCRVVRRLDHGSRKRDDIVQLGEMGHGDMVGAYEVIYGGPRRDSVFATCDTHFLELNARDLTSQRSRGAMGASLVESIVDIVVHQQQAFTSVLSSIWGHQFGGFISRGGHWSDSYACTVDLEKPPSPPNNTWSGPRHDFAGMPIGKTYSHGGSTARSGGHSTQRSHRELEPLHGDGGDSHRLGKPLAKTLPLHRDEAEGGWTENDDVSPSHRSAASPRAPVQSPRAPVQPPEVEQQHHDDEPDAASELLVPLSKGPHSDSSPPPAPRQHLTLPQSALSDPLSSTLGASPPATSPGLSPSRPIALMSPGRMQDGLERVSPLPPPGGWTDTNDTFVTRVMVTQGRPALPQRQANPKQGKRSNAVAWRHRNPVPVDHGAAPVHHAVSPRNCPPPPKPAARHNIQRGPTGWGTKGKLPDRFARKQESKQKGQLKAKLNRQRLITTVQINASGQTRPLQLENKSTESVVRRLFPSVAHTRNPAQLPDNPAWTVSPWQPLHGFAVHESGWAEPQPAREPWGRYVPSHLRSKLEVYQALASDDIPRYANSP